MYFVSISVGLIMYVNHMRKRMIKWNKDFYAEKKKNERVALTSTWQLVRKKYSKI